MGRQITPHIPVWDKSARCDGTFSRADFVFDRSRNIYIYPNGKLLHTTGTVIDGGTLRYRASKRDCDGCALKMQCCPHTPSRQIPRDLHEDARDVARALAKTEAFEQSRRERKKVEMCFAHMKRILNTQIRFSCKKQPGFATRSPRKRPHRCTALSDATGQSATSLPYMRPGNRCRFAVELPAGHADFREFKGSDDAFGGRATLK